MIERIGIIGGGFVGIALARALAQAGSGDVTVFEKEHRLATHQTGHNSGVVHAGLYYASGSLKAQLCVAGRVALRDFCLQKNLPYREVGKLVVAVDESELPALAEIEKRSRANGVPGLARIDGAARLHAIEPHVTGVAAVHSPHTAVVDFAAITEAMAQDARTAGGTILLGQEVVAMAIEGGTVRVGTAGSEHVFDRVIACAGLQSDVVARLLGADPAPKTPLPGRILVTQPGATASGVRAQAWGRDGSLLDDFAVDQMGPVTLLRNAPSPAATSCLAIANYLLDQYVKGPSPRTRT